MIAELKRAMRSVRDFVLFLLAQAMREGAIRVDGFQCNVATRRGAGEMQEFAKLFAPAFTLIKVVDPVRYRRVRKQIGMVLLAPMPVAAWKRVGRVCLIDPARCAADLSSDHTLATRLAGAIVGAATRGLIAERSNATWREAGERIWRLCNEEERRFLTRGRRWEKMVGVEHVALFEKDLTSGDDGEGER